MQLWSSSCCGEDLMRSCLLLMKGRILQQLFLAFSTQKQIYCQLLSLIFLQAIFPSTETTYTSKLIYYLLYLDKRKLTIKIMQLWMGLVLFIRQIIQGLFFIVFQEVEVREQFDNNFYFYCLLVQRKSLATANRQPSIYFSHDDLVRPFRKCFISFLHYCSKRVFSATPPTSPSNSSPLYLLACCYLWVEG